MNLTLHDEHGVPVRVLAVDWAGDTALIDYKGRQSKVTETMAAATEDRAIAAGRLNPAERGTCETCRAFLDDRHDHFRLPDELETALGAYAVTAELRAEHVAEYVAPTFARLVRSRRLEQHVAFDRAELIEALRAHFRPHCAPNTGEGRGELAAINMARRAHGLAEIPHAITQA